MFLLNRKHQIRKCREIHCSFSIRGRWLFFYQLSYLTLTIFLVDTGASAITAASAGALTVTSAGALAVTVAVTSASAVASAVADCLAFFDLIQDVVGVFPGDCTV